MGGLFGLLSPRPTTLGPRVAWRSYGGQEEGKEGRLGGWEARGSRSKAKEGVKGGERWGFYMLRKTSQRKGTSRVQGHWPL